MEINISALPIINENVSFSFKNSTPKNTLTIGSKVPSIDEDDTPIMSIAFKSKIIDSIVETIEIPRQQTKILKFKFKVIELLNAPHKTVPMAEPKQRYIVVTLLSKELIDFRLSAIKVSP